MGLIQRLDASDLKRIFKYRDKDYFSDEAYQFIVNYYDELGQDKELDVDEICSNFTEVNKSFSSILANYGKGSTLHSLSNTYLIVH